jgi:uncharacterized protein YuzE
VISSSYDVEADALYLQLRKGKVARTEELDDGTLVDVDAHGEPLGVEVIHPARPWPLQELIGRYNITGATKVLLEQFGPTSPHSAVRGYPQTRTTSVALAT